ncbi:MAG: hypothetical protein GX495_09990 [Chloroflexi bacterium]|nr:hypothetical protein [Chloroflexota bacterium]
MDDVQKALIIVGITLAAVFLINALIYYSIVHRRRKNSKGWFSEIGLMRKVVKRARDPWFVEDEMLRELSKSVAGLKGKDIIDDTSRGVEESPSPD